MTRTPWWQAEIDEMMGHEPWALTGERSLVKVTDLKSPVYDAQGGYFTTAGYIDGCTVDMIERKLGFRNEYFPDGVRIYAFARLPGPSEYTYEMTTKFPDGLAYIEGSSDPTYPPGTGAVHQWCLRPGIRIPVLPSRTVVVGRDQRYRLSR